MAMGTEIATVGDHAVHFYGGDSDLATAVVSYLAGAIRAGEAAIVIATEARRRAFSLELEATGIDPAEALLSGSLILLDAEATLSSVMPSGRIDHDAFHEVVGGLLGAAAARGQPVRAYGEMVALLWDAGNVLGAIELESLWNDLARGPLFSLLCASPLASVSRPSHPEAFEQVCHLHSSVQTAADFGTGTEAPCGARRFVVGALRQWGCATDLVDDAALVVTELATNVVVHVNKPFSVAVRTEHDSVRLAVHDPGAIAPSMRYPSHGAQTGRGLGIVAALANNWGVEMRTDGKTVWAELRGRTGL